MQMSLTKFVTCESPTPQYLQTVDCNVDSNKGCKMRASLAAAIFFRVGQSLEAKCCTSWVFLGGYCCPVGGMV
jgi:hypothetical protein